MNRVLLTLLMLTLLNLALFAQEQTHVVQKGETVYAIGRKYGISASELLRFNNISDPTKIAIGTSLKIPGTTSSSTTAATEVKQYKVVKGDTLYSLSRKWGMSVSELLRFNNLSSNYVLQIGDLLKYTSKGGNSTTVVTTTPSGGTSQPEPAPTTASTQVANAGGKWPHPGPRSALTGQLRGVAIKAKAGDAITSLRAGKVVWLGPYRGYGQVAFIQTSDDYIYVYGGASAFSLKTGHTVSAGAKIGVVGTIDDGMGQVIFMVYKGGRSIDPVSAPR